MSSYFPFFYSFPVALFLLTTLIFTLFAALSRSGWALGRIITTSVLMPQTVPCPPAMTELGPKAKCKASKLVIFTSRINYGTCTDTQYTLIYPSFFDFKQNRLKTLTLSHIHFLSPSFSLTQTNTGLFGDIKYETTSETSIHIRAKTPEGVARTWLEKKSILVSSNIQSSYEHWYGRFLIYRMRARVPVSLLRRTVLEGSVFASFFLARGLENI